jgi:hypothetical protein
MPQWRQLQLVNSTLHRQQQQQHLACLCCHGRSGRRGSGRGSSSSRGRRVPGLLLTRWWRCLGAGCERSSALCGEVIV